MKLRKEEPWMGAAGSLRKKSKERKGHGVKWGLNYKFWEGPRRLPTLISLSG